MHTRNLFTILVLLLLAGCTPAGRMYISEDDFKDQSVYKLEQRLPAYSDESKRLLPGPNYRVSFKHFFAEGKNEAEEYSLDLAMRTRVRAEELEPRLYISLDGQITTLDSEKQLRKTYQESSTSTTTDSTGTSTSTSVDTYQLMHLHFAPDASLLEELASAREVVFKLYLGNEGIEVPLRRKKQNKLKAYVERIRAQEAG